MKTILVFVNGGFINSIPYRTKKEAWKQYKFFKRKGILSGETGQPITGATFELI